MQECVLCFKKLQENMNYQCLKLVKHLIYIKACFYLSYLNSIILMQLQLRLLIFYVVLLIEAYACTYRVVTGGT